VSHTTDLQQQKAQTSGDDSSDDDDMDADESSQQSSQQSASARGKTALATASATRGLYIAHFNPYTASTVVDCRVIMQGSLLTASQCTTLMQACQHCTVLCC
jgi:hypothetical protein